MISRHRDSHGRQLRTYAAIALACLICWCTLLVHLVSFPTVDEPEPVDAVFVIGPPWPERVAAGVALIEAGYADTLIVSVDTEDDFTADEISVCHDPTDFEVICLTPEPFTTQGEARDLARLAAQNGWDSAIVVTMIPHITRASVYFDRCTGGMDVLFVDDHRSISPLRWAWYYLYQAGAWAKGALIWDC